MTDFARHALFAQNKYGSYISSVITSAYFGVASYAYVTLPSFLAVCSNLATAKYIRSVRSFRLRQTSSDSGYTTRTSLKQPCITSFVPFSLRLRRTSSDFGYVTTPLSSVMHKNSHYPSPSERAGVWLKDYSIEYIVFRNPPLLASLLPPFRQRSSQQGHSLSRYAVHSGCVSGSNASLPFSV